MDASELAGLAEQTGIAADPRAGREFRVAAVRLSEHEPETDAHVDASSEAARLLISLSLAEATDELRRLLTPDPAELKVSWTVTCFQLGELTPSSTREFGDPVEAIATVADCADAAHVASELVASTAQGLQWTAIARTHDRVLFQLPGSDTVSDTSLEPAGDAAAAALRRWRKRLADWSAHSGSERDVEVIARLDAIGPSPAASTFVVDERFGALEKRLAGIEESINGLSLVLETLTLAARDHDAVDNSVEVDTDGRLIALESAVRDALTEFEGRRGVRVDAVDERVDGLGLESRFAALESVVRDVVAAASQDVSRPVVDVEQRLSARVDHLEQQLITTVRDASSETAAGLVDVSDRISALRLAIDTEVEIRRLREMENAARSVTGSTAEPGAEERATLEALRDEIATVFAGLRAGLTPLTNEVVRRMGSIERTVHADMARTTSDLRDDIVQLREAVASLQRDFAAAIDLRLAADLLG